MTAEILKALFHRIWQYEVVPKEWLISVIVPLYKKGSRSLVSNYRGISLLCLASKALENVVLDRFRSARESRTRENQAGFRPGRGCVDQIFSIRRILEFRHEYRQPTAVAFIDFKAAFDSVDRESVWKIMLADGLPPKLMNLISSLYSATKASVRVYGQLSDHFDVCTGVRQGAITSPVIFNYVVDWVLEESVKACLQEGVAVGFTHENSSITDFDYADDVGLLASSAPALNRFVHHVSRLGGQVGLSISAPKSKVLACCLDPPTISLEGSQLENVDSFCYLGSNIKATGDARNEIRSRIARATHTFNGLHKSLWSRNEVTLSTKMRVFRACVQSVLIYACETWPVLVEDARRLDAFECRCLRRILGVHWEDKRSNFWVRKAAHCEISASKLIHIRRLRYFGHVLRMPGIRLPNLCLFLHKPQDWRRPHGRAIKTWIRQVHQETRHLTNVIRHHSGSRKDWDPDGRLWIEYLRDLAQNRANWVDLTRAVVHGPDDQRGVTFGA